MINKNVLLADTFASKFENSSVLSGVLFKGNKESVTTCATDGSRLIEITTKCTDSAEYPVINGVSDRQEPYEFIIPSGFVKELATNYKKLKLNNAIQPILDNIVLDSSVNGKVKFAYTDLDKTEIKESRTITGNFPDYKNLLPDLDTHELKIACNVEYLEQVCKTIKELNKNAGSRANIIVMHLDKNNNLAPIMFTTSKGTEENSGTSCKALIMPVQLKDS